MRGKQRAQTQGLKAPLVGGCYRNYAAFWVLSFSGVILQKNTQTEQQSKLQLQQCMIISQQATRHSLPYIHHKFTLV